MAWFFKTAASRGCKSDSDLLRKPRRVRSLPKRRRKLLIFVGLCVAIYLSVCVFLTMAFLRPARWVSRLSPGLQEVRIATRGGVNPSFVTPNLAAGHPSDTVFVMAHGYHGSREAYCHMMLAVKGRGFDSVAPSMPGQDASPEETVGFGVKEARTLVDMVRWARKQGAKRVVLLGVSMGGAAAWLATDEDPTIDGVITESAYAQFDQAMNRWFEHKAPGASIYLRPVVWFASWATGLNPSKIRPIDAAAKWRGKPALVIQGEADSLIEMSHATRLAEAAGCELWRVPLATHAQCSICAEQEYVDRIAKFAASLDRASPAAQFLP